MAVGALEKAGVDFAVSISRYRRPWRRHAGKTGRPGVDFRASPGATDGSSIASAVLARSAAARCASVRWSRRRARRWNWRAARNWALKTAPRGRQHPLRRPLAAPHRREATPRAAGVLLRVPGAMRRAALLRRTGTHRKLARPRTTACCAASEERGQLRLADRSLPINHVGALFERGGKTLESGVEHGAHQQRPASDVNS